MVEPSAVEDRIRQNIAEVAHIEIRDLTGTKDHYEAVIVSPVFDGLNRIAQQRLVFAALGELMDGPIHALTLKTYTPERWASAGGRA